MIKSRSKWRIRGRFPAIEQELINELKLDPFVARLLAQRGVQSAAEGRQFLFFDGPVFHDPFLFQDMSAAVKRIRQAIAAGEKIRIYGDYDCDGVSSTALMCMLMQHLGANFDPYIPHRVKEGYGLNPDAIRKAKVDGIGLIITVDTGISANPEIALANELGIDVIVTDHHEPPDPLPPAGWIINPKVASCGYPYRDLAGVGVALKLAQAMLGTDRVPEQWTQMAAIGTVADMMPLNGENRSIVYTGIQSIRRSPLPGIRALIQIAGGQAETVTAGDIGYIIGPRINASGRMDAAQPALELYLSSVQQEAERLAVELHQSNAERQELVKKVAEEALAQVTAEMVRKDGILIVKSAEWPMGVVGIAAARLMDTFQRPVIVMRLDEASGEAKGSARAPKGIDLIGMLRELDHYFTHYGGHAVAAGLSLHQTDLAAFEADIKQKAFERYGSDLLNWRSELEVDAMAEEFSVDVASIEQLDRLEPFGIGNPKPLILFHESPIREVQWIGKTKETLKMKFDGFEALKFRADEWKPHIRPEQSIAFVGEPGLNVWQNRKSAQVMIKDARQLYPQVDVYQGEPQGPVCRWETNLQEWMLPERFESSMTSDQLYVCLEDPLNLQHIEKLFQFLLSMPNVFRVFLPERLFASGQSAGARTGWTLPDRETWVAVYRMIRSREAWPDTPVQWQLWQKQCKLELPLLKQMLLVFEQLEWLSRDSDGFRILPAPKRELSEAPAYRELISHAEPQAQFSGDEAGWTVDRLQDWIKERYLARVSEGVFVWT